MRKFTIYLAELKSPHSVLGTAGVIGVGTCWGEGGGGSLDPPGGGGSNPPTLGPPVLRGLLPSLPSFFWKINFHIHFLAMTLLTI